ncbi:hypothetical protein [Planococcus halotolerans]|uniref:hypothetical protein n=1 Tax=Planococcus halotolerans TaxID=2233542 RepID=UPI003F7A7393
MDRKPEKNFQLIGNINLSNKEEIQESRICMGVWKNFSIQLVYDVNTLGGINPMPG